MFSAFSLEFSGDFLAPVFITIFVYLDVSFWAFCKQGHLFLCLTVSEGVCSSQVESGIPRPDVIYCNQCTDKMWPFLPNSLPSVLISSASLWSPNTTHTSLMTVLVLRLITRWTSNICLHQHKTLLPFFSPISAPLLSSVTAVIFRCFELMLESAFSSPSFFALHFLSVCIRTWDKTQAMRCL